MQYPDHIEKPGDQALFAAVIRKRIERTPDDWYISDDGKTLYALLAGSYLWSMSAPDDANFHTMTAAKISVLIFDHLSKILD